MLYLYFRISVAWHHFTFPSGAFRSLNIRTMTRVFVADHITYALMAHDGCDTSPAANLRPPCRVWHMVGVSWREMCQLCGESTSALFLAEAASVRRTQKTEFSRHGGQRWNFFGVGPIYGWHKSSILMPHLVHLTLSSSYSSLSNWDLSGSILLIQIALTLCWTLDHWPASHCLCPWGREFMNLFSITRTYKESWFNVFKVEVQ